MWTALTDSPPPPIDYNVQRHKKYWSFLRGADLVGQYADFYSQEKLEYKLGSRFKIINYNYICGPRKSRNGSNYKGCFCTVIIKAVQ